MNLVLGTVSKQLDVAGLAVGIVEVLLECAFVEQLETEGTLKVGLGGRGGVCVHGEREKMCVYGRGGVCMDEEREDGVYGRFECAWMRRGRGGVCMDEEGRMVYKEGVECACMGRGCVYGRG